MSVVYGITSRSESQSSSFVLQYCCSVMDKSRTRINAEIPARFVCRPQSRRRYRMYSARRARPVAVSGIHVRSSDHDSSSVYTFFPKRRLTVLCARITNRTKSFRLANGLGTVVKYRSSIVLKCPWQVGHAMQSAKDCIHVRARLCSAEEGVSGYNAETV